MDDRPAPVNVGFRPLTQLTAMNDRTTREGQSHSVDWGMKGEGVPLLEAGDEWGRRYIVDALRYR